MKHFVGLGALCLLISSAAATAAPDFTEGREYQLISPAAPTSVSDGKVEVVELFWYGCPHCYAFEPHVKQWLKEKPAEAEYVPVPATLNPRWVVHARTFYALQSLGELERVHEKFFQAIHEQNRRLRDVNAIARFLAQQDIEEDKFRQAFDSIEIDAKIKREQQVSAIYGVSGVPAVIVAGKYRTSATLAGGYDKMIEVINFLVRRESGT